MLRCGLWACARLSVGPLAEERGFSCVLVVFVGPLAVGELGARCMRPRSSLVAVLVSSSLGAGRGGWGLEPRGGVDSVGCLKWRAEMLREREPMCCKVAQQLPRFCERPFDRPAKRLAARANARPLRSLLAAHRRERPCAWPGTRKPEASLSPLAVDAGGQGESEVSSTSSWSGVPLQPVDVASSWPRWLLKLM